MLISGSWEEKTSTMNQRQQSNSITRVPSYGAARQIKRWFIVKFNNKKGDSYWKLKVWIICLKSSQLIRIERKRFNFRPNHGMYTIFLSSCSGSMGMQSWFSQEVFGSGRVEEIWWFQVPNDDNKMMIFELLHHCTTRSFERDEKQVHFIQKTEGNASN